MPVFIPDLPVILAFAVASLILAVTPGADMALFLSRTINYGRGAQGLTHVFTRSRWVERALNWSFAGVFTAFAATILLAEGKR